jgi:hypothetical protein
MAKQKLFPERPDADENDTRQPHERFTDLASRIVNVPKEEVDKREQQWQKNKDR